jgi:signal transduction histidine kinase/DNA-binding response OmpR family regulator
MISLTKREQGMKKSKISTKFLKIIIYVSLATFLISLVFTFFIMQDIQKNTQEMIKHNIAVKIRNKIENGFRLGITNAIAIAQDRDIKSALVDFDKEKAYGILKDISEDYAKYTFYKKGKIHIHTKDVKSFLRSWDKDHNGDDLSGFRYTINTVKKTQKPVLGIEVGWADLVIRAIVPIMQGDEYLGSLEVIQDFSNVIDNFENEDKYLFTLIDTKLLKNQPDVNNVISGYAMMQGKYNQEFFATLRGVNFKKLVEEGSLISEDKFFALKPIIGFNDSFIGYYVVGMEYKNVLNIVSKSHQVAYTFLGLMVFMAFVIVLVTNITIKKLITNNVIKVSDGLTSFFNFLNKKSDSIEKIDIDTKDEIGQMAYEINSNITFIKNLLNEEKKENWIKDGLSGLSKELAKNTDLVNLSNNVTRFVCEYVNAGVGTLYIHDAKNKTLKLYGTYAYVHRNELSSSFKLGEATIGQVALQKTPIHLNHITRDISVIDTGTTSEPPLNVYTFPLIYQDVVYGVLEIGSTQYFGELESRFFEVCGEAIATSLFSSIQNDKVKILLEESEQANKKLQEQQKITEQSNIELQKQQSKLEEANAQMQEQQAQLEEANSQMQEQQAQLEEANAQMEEQQVQLKESEKELKKQNKQLQISQEQLNKKAKDLENSNRYKSEFLANMSHELRTPLNSIILLSSMLKENKKENLSEEDIKKANIINSSGEELLRLINDVLDLSKVEAGKMELLVEKFDSTEFSKQINDMFETAAKNKGLELVVEDKYKGDIYTDRDKLSQVVRNFLSNSLKFTHEGFIKLTIEKSGDDKVSLSVQDSGIGIPKNKQDLIFQAFAQVDGSTSREYGGTGLGLSITKEMVKLMKGEISLESEEKKGSTFSIVIPNLRSENLYGKTPPLEDEKTASPKIYDTKEPEIEIYVEDDRDKIGADDKPFLVIEDNPDFASTLKNVINDKGDLAYISASGKKGIELARQNPNIQGVLLDLGLPDMDGLEVLKQLKSDKLTKSIPVYIISGRDNYDRKNFVDAVGFKQKPLNNEDFKTVFEKFEQFNNKKVKDLLVVEDDEIQRDIMIKYISSIDVNIEGVDNVEDAIEQISTGKYDAIVVDLTLKGKSGLQICEYIKQNDLTIPIVVYTGKVLSEEDENKIKKYTDSIIIKSATSQERLLDEVERFLHKAKKDSKGTNKKSLSIDNINFDDKKILVVDDDMRNTFVLVEILEGKGAQVLTASNGEEALDVLASNKDTNLVLMDIMMPVMDGYEAIEKIRADKELENIPVIAVTAKAMNQDKEKCFEVGANDFLTKPLNLDTFVGVVQAWIK